MGAASATVSETCFKTSRNCDVGRMKRECHRRVKTAGPARWYPISLVTAGTTRGLNGTSGDFMVVWSTIRKRSSKSGRLRDVGAEGPDGFWSWWRC